jgi:predicted ATPase
MINHLEIKSFKCIRHESLDFAPLTLLAGPNSSGKSTVIQAILLGAGICEQENLVRLKEVVKPFSRFSEVYNRYDNASSVEIKITGRGWDVPLYRTLSASGNAVTEPVAPGVLAYESNLFYLCANRVGPEALAELNLEMKIGESGQYALGYFERRKDKPVHESLVEGKAPAKTLKAQVAWWLSFITGYEVGPVVEKVTEFQVRVSFNTPELGEISPLNSGAGTSYLLKLLVMCLTAEPGHVLLMENPEIHLHPAAQARLGCLFAFLASSGVQVIAETHCEHLVNRVRYEVYKKNLSAESCVIHYKPDDKTPFSRLGINERGHFVNPDGHETAFPGGFFDSTLSELLEMS